MTHERDGLGRRLRQVRMDLYGENGGPMLAEALRLPVRTWINYESGMTVPGAGHAPLHRADGGVSALVADRGTPSV